MFGRYEATLENATDIITLLDDNHFTEELQYKSGKKLLNQGEWTLLENSISLKNAFGLDGGFPVSEKYLATVSVVLPIETRWGRVDSFGIHEFAVFAKVQ